jgi:hypothetical protein
METLRDYDWVVLAERVGITLVILIVTWSLARLVKLALTKLVGNVGFLQRQGADGKSLGAALGQIASLLVWLFGLIAILQVFSLDQVLSPIQVMLDNLMAYLPNVIGAGFVFFVGYVIAKIARQLTQTTLDTAGLDRGVARLTDGQIGNAASAREDTVPGHEGGATTASELGTDRSAGTSVSSVVADLVFAITLIVVSIAALQILGIQAISEPAESMLQLILDAIPRVIAAALLLGLGWFIAKFAGQLLETTLRGLGTDRTINELGIVPEGRSASSILRRIAQVAIILFFGVMATRMLGFPEVTNLLEEVLVLGGRVLFGGALIAAGVMIAGLLRRTIGTGTVSSVVYWATIALFTAMGLNYMGIADSIVNLAFGAVVVGGALAAALAFGLGGREAAARQLNKAETKLERGKAEPTV